MDIGSLLKLLVRRWVIIVIGLVLTGTGLYFVQSKATPSYQATGRMLLLLPADARGPGAEGSPFLYLPAGLNVLASIVAVAPDSREFASGLASRGLTSGFEVGVDPGSPTLTVSVTGRDPDNVIATRGAVIDGLAAELAKVQEEENTPVRQTAHARVYAAEDAPTALGGDSMRAMLAVGAAGAILTLVTAIGVDRLLAYRRSRPKRSAAEDQDPATATE